MTWNTGEASDLRRDGNKTHAEAQFFNFIRDKVFDSIEIEISHSPCTACIDMLAGWLRNIREHGATVTKEPNRRVGHRVYVGSTVKSCRIFPLSFGGGSYTICRPRRPRGNIPGSPQGWMAIGRARHGTSEWHWNRARPVALARKERAKSPAWH